MISRFSEVVMRAQGLIGGGVHPVGVPDNVTDITDMIRTVISTAYAIAGVVTVGFLMFAGYMYIFSAGDAEKVRKAMSTIFNSIVGLVVIVCSALIFNFVARRLGVEDIVSTLNLPFR